MKSSHFLSKAPGEVPEPTGATNVRLPSTQYLVVDSADRNQNSSFNPIGASGQPWNNFRIQKRQAILNAFARRIQPAEIRFPWFIPNITKYNNTLWIAVANDPNLLAVSLPLNTGGAYVGFYTPSEICTALNAALATAIPVDPPVLSYDTATLSYTMTADAANAVIGMYASPTAPTVLSPGSFAAVPSLFKTLGFTVDQQGITFDGFMKGLPTLSSYTDYVDICSDKMMYYTDVKDGSSADRASSTSVMIRLYATDEVSIPPITAGVPSTCAPFVIHRQFKNAKSIQWNPEAVIDWMDVQVYDMYGNLVPLPRYNITSTQGLIDGSYPDFQITFLASEN